MFSSFLSPNERVIQTGAQKISSQENSHEDIIMHNFFSKQFCFLYFKNGLPALS